MGRSRARIGTHARQESRQTRFPVVIAAIGLVAILGIGGTLACAPDGSDPTAFDGGAIEQALLDELLPDDALAEDAISDSPTLPTTPESTVQASASLTIDTSGLAACVDRAVAIEPGAYSSQSYAVLQEALAQARAVQSDISATDASVAEAEARLNQALEALSVDTSQLGDLIVEAWNVDGAAYTEDSYASMRGVLDAVGLIYNDPSATQAQVSQAVVDLRQSMDALVVWEPAPAIEPEPLVAEAPIGRVVYITKSGEKYHAGGCRYLKKSKIEISLDDALARGYTPCSVCGG